MIKDHLELIVITLKGSSECDRCFQSRACNLNRLILKSNRKKLIFLSAKYLPRNS
jgi:hypothetical protein